MKYRKLKETIQEKGYRLDYIAKELGITPTTLSFKIKGTCIFKITEIYKIIDILKLNQDEIMKIFFKL
jgi:DNA-binding helix-turn-helix protein|nr:MAG TPA: Protein of unknown function (DUF739) [Caudoviricetes sp.]